jgi:hypothetical protein
MKKCGHCKKLFPLEEFTKNRTTKDGLYCYCKTCKAKKRAKYYQEHKEQFKIYQHEWDVKNKDKVKMYKKRNGWKYREKINKSSLIYLNKFPEKHKARVLVAKLIREGVLIKQPCEVCGELKVDAHHYLGYEEKHWADVKWLCFKHHRELHIKDTKLSIQSKGKIK